MASKFQTIIKRARLSDPGLPPQAMIELGNSAIAAIQARMLRSQDVHDQTAPPLAPGYAKFKSRKYGSSVRDMRKTGQTFRGMKVLQAGQNYCIIGFVDPVAANRIRLNNAKSRMWGLSDVDRRVIYKTALDLTTRVAAVIQEA